MCAFIPQEIVDEGFQGLQIRDVYSGNWQAPRNLTIPPTYHFVVVEMMRCLQFFSIDMLRFFSLTVALSFLSGYVRISQTLLII